MRPTNRMLYRMHQGCIVPASRLSLCIGAKPRELSLETESQGNALRRLKQPCGTHGMWHKFESGSRE
ncbi:hypothetical protein MTO96_018430 [Rhipicephalus appendiculatus]